MEREISAGGVVVRRSAEGWQVAVIEPQKDDSAETGAKSKDKKWQKLLLALPKGLVDKGEKPEQTAIREVREETGLNAIPVAKLATVKYVYVRSWGNRERVFKIVTFYLLRYVSGEIDNVAPEMRIEVRRALWIALEEAAQKLAYSGEKDTVREAQKYLASHPELDEGA
ncbi:MAG TPA: NUDIX domain-containing protein [Terriglobales bacterium]|nr:NUDIX domain-containing protein [Terriglobales bacterium]